MTRLLREASAVANAARERGVSAEQVTQERHERRVATTTRRQFLGAALAATAGLTMARPLRALGGAPRIVVVGGGLAGLRFAHALWTRKGVAATIYESNTRLGGRCWSNRDFFAGGQVAEHGGEFISTEHTSMRKLATQFGLSLAKVYGGSEPGFDDANWLDEAYYTDRELYSDLLVLQPKLRAARASAPYPTLYNHYTPGAYELDHMSCAEWISQNVEGGTTGRLGRILLTNQLAEYGLEPAVQSALNLIYLIGGSFQRDGLSGTDEWFHIVGGNDQVATMMAEELPQDSLQTGMTLLALRHRSDGTYTCTFGTDSTTVDVGADHVVLALPFNKLKLIDLTQAGFSPVKMAAINGYALGTNAKLALQFKSRPWAQPDRWSGTCYTAPDDFELSWDATVSQQGPSGILLRYPGGNAGGPGAFPGASAHGVAPAQYVQDFLSGVERPFPGCEAAYNGLAWLDWWVQDPFIGGAYGCYQVGNWTSFAGIEKVSQGNVHFCGEQTSLNFQGFMEGAVRSAEDLALRSGIF